MMKATAWIDGGVNPMPDRPGEYEVRNNPNRDMWPRRGWMLNSNSVTRRYWNGARWLAWKGGVSSVMGRPGLHQWRGLTKPSEVA